MSREISLCCCRIQDKVNRYSICNITALYAERFIKKKNDVLLEKLNIQYKFKPVNTRVNFDKVNYQKNSSLCIFFFQPFCWFFFLLFLVVCVFSLSSSRLIVIYLFFFAGYLQLYLEISWLILYCKFFLFEFNISRRIFPVAN